MEGQEGWEARRRSYRGHRCPHVESKPSATRARGRRNPGQTRGSGNVPEMRILEEGSDALAKSRREVTKPHPEGFRPGGQPITSLHLSQPHPGLFGPLPVGSQAGRYVLAAKGFTPFSGGTPGVQGLGRLLKDYSCAPLGSWMSPLRIPETGGGEESAQVGCMRQALGPGALGRPRGIRWRGRWEGDWDGEHL